METQISKFREILIRLGLKSPKIFALLQRIFIIVGILFVALTAFNSQLPNTHVTQFLKIAGIIGSSLSAGIIFASGIPVDNTLALDRKIDDVLEKKNTDPEEIKA